MSTFLSDADVATSELGRRARAVVSVADAAAGSLLDELADRRSVMTVEQQIVIAYRSALADRDRKEMDFLRSSARAIDPALVDELDGFNYPAAA